MREVEKSVKRMVESEIETIAQKVLNAHVEPLVIEKMSYIVIHANKKAIFKLKNRDDTFGHIKEKIAEYFGLPKDRIFLRNQNGEILLTR